jgi:hypothetical protein
MGEPKTRASDASVADFLAQLPDGRRADCEAVAAMMQAATGEPATMWGASIVGFGRYAAVSAGKANAWPLIGFSPRRNELVLYLVAGFDGADALLDRLGRHRTGKACLYVKKLADVDATVLRRLIDASVAAMEAKRIR